MNITVGDVIQCPGRGIYVNGIIDDKRVVGLEYPFICCELPFVLNVKDIIWNGDKWICSNNGKTEMFPCGDQVEWSEKCDLQNKVGRLDKKRKKYIDRIAELDNIMNKKRHRL